MLTNILAFACLGTNPYDPCFAGTEHPCGYRTPVRVHAIIEQPNTCLQGFSGRTSGLFRFMLIRGKMIGGDYLWWKHQVFA